MDAVEFRLHLDRIDHVAIRLGAEIQLYSRPEAPFQRHFVNVHRRFAAVHSGREVPRRVHVRPVVRCDLQSLHGPALGVREDFRRETRKHCCHLLRPGLMVGVIDLRSCPADRQPHHFGGDERH